MENSHLSPSFVPHSHNILHVLQNANLAESTRQKYIRVVESYLATGGSLTDAPALAALAATISRSRRGHLKSAVRKWTEVMATAVKSQATPDNIQVTQATLLRFEALQDSIQVSAAKGQKVHTWLSQAEVKRLLSLPDTRTRLGRRDKIALGLCVAAGLRREEAVSVQFADLTHLPLGQSYRTVVNVRGKGAKDRAVPIRAKLAADIAVWGQEIGADGYLLRSLGRGNAVGESLTAVSLFRIVAKYGGRIGKPELAPHDLRRTYAQLGYEAGVPVTQISTLLGHASLETTMRYLNLQLDFQTTVSDFIPYERMGA
ncbi:MAG: site-specific integrase [Chloroflexi bacterium]|nr:site-specific integrase [Chloroflexota bacterium]